MVTSKQCRRMAVAAFALGLALAPVLNPAAALIRQQPVAGAHYRVEISGGTPRPCSASSNTF